jgi:hypothetical protein
MWRKKKRKEKRLLLMLVFLFITLGESGGDERNGTCLCNEEIEEIEND